MKIRLLLTLNQNLVLILNWQNCPHWNKIFAQQQHKPSSSTSLMLSVNPLGCSATTKTAGLKIQILAESRTRTWILYFPQLPSSSTVYLSLLTPLNTPFIFLIPPPLPHCHFPPWHWDLLHSLHIYTLLCI